MQRRHHYRRRASAQAELDMTTFLNLMVVLVPFLLITAVFSRITVVELSLPSSAGGPAAAEPTLRIEVVVRDQGLEVTRNDARVATIPKVDGAYDLAALSGTMVELKRRHPGHDGASVLLEPDIAYDHLIQVMDAVRSADLPANEGGAGAADDDGEVAATETDSDAGLVRVALFQDISIGDAP